MHSPQYQSLTPELQQNLHLAFQYWKGGRLAEAEALYRQILAQRPGRPEVLQPLGALLMQRGQPEAALPLLEQAREADPGNGQHWLALTQCLLELDRPKEAKKVISEAIRKGLRHPMADELLKQARSGHKKKPERPLNEALRELDGLFRAGSYAEVEKRARALVRQHAKSTQAWYLMGMSCLSQGRYEEALQPLGRAIELNPRSAEAHFNHGYVLEYLDRLEEALEAYRKALDIQPGLVEAHNNLGNALQKLERHEEALPAYRRAAELRPGVVEYHMNLGQTLRCLGRHEEAVAAYRRALEMKPDFAECYKALGLALQELARYEEARAAFQSAAALKHPGFEEAHNLLAGALSLLGRHDEAIATYRQALANEPDGLFVTHSNLLMDLNYVAGLAPEAQLAEARAYGEKAARKAVPLAAHGNDPDPARRLRIGLVSGDLGQHPVGYFLVNVLEALDPGQVGLYAYATAERKDELNERLRRAIPHWREAMRSSMDDEALVRQVQADGIDILIDLAGHTGKNRLPVFAWKPAPVQVAWLGYFATTGLEAMDYILADRWVLPPDDEGHFVEQAWRLPDAYYCFSPPDVPIAVALLPAERNGYLTFGCFNNPRKLNDRVVGCWARVLKAVPGSRLFLKYKSFQSDTLRESIGDRFARLGIDRERLRFEGKSPRAEYLAAYQDVDIALDPFPFPGGTTSVESLWMGVPVLTLKGDRFIGHQGETILQNAGLPDWIAADEDEYVAKAAAFAGDLPALARLRAGLRERLVASPLCDAPRFARNLENALRGMWRKWCEQQAAAQE